MSTAWILIVSWAVTAGQGTEFVAQSVYRSQAIAMQEFHDLKSCQFASVEAQKIAPGIKVVCVPKGGQS